MREVLKEGDWVGVGQVTVDEGGGAYHVEGREAAEAVGPQGRQQLPRWGGAPIAPAASPSKVAWVGGGGGGGLCGLAN